MAIVDAYCHIGLPRFGTPEDALRTLGLWSIERAVFVLGPQVPDYPTLLSALQSYGDRIRGIGIPFGTTAPEVEEAVLLQLRAGVLGLRMEPSELLSYPRVLAILGERARWLYAIGAISSPEVARTLLTWLERYPAARVAAPHFLAPGLPLAGDVGDEIRQELLSHPRFYAILSRHGGVGSSRAYPHEDLRAWVLDAISRVGWGRLLWGSEYPVLFWRNETLGDALRWLSELLPECSDESLQAFLGGTAERVLFGNPPPEAESVQFPEWIAARFNRERTVPLFPGGLSIPMALYDKLHHQYVECLQQDRQLTFAQAVIDRLAR